MLEGVDRITSRMQQLETQLNSGPMVDSDAFNQFMGDQAKPAPKKSAPSANAAQTHLLTSRGFSSDPSAFGTSRSGSLNVTPIAQHTSDSCGQTSVAMSINALTGKKLDDNDINAKYGYELLRALKDETAEAGYTWKDGGEINPNCWELLEHKVNNEKTPVVVALNGPEFSVSGRGHIVTITKIDGDKVTFADPATGTVRTTTKQNMNNAPSHPQGNFIFYADRLESGGTETVAANP
ncbi:MAG: C39 family peptidase [Vulcanimicrobiota bacterium]